MSVSFSLVCERGRRIVKEDLIDLVVLAIPEPQHRAVQARPQLSENIEDALNARNERLALATSAHASSLPKTWKADGMRIRLLEK
jgi:hypothetical protein